MLDNCVCGCSVDDHEYPGGACSSCWHCQYVEYDAPMGSIPPGGLPDQKWIDENPRRWW